MYKSPFNLIVNDMYAAFDKEVENAVVTQLCQEYGIEIDKNKLNALLMQDKQSYDDGYRDGWEAAQREFYRPCNFSEADKC